jgi:hypothetical protein
MKWSALVCLWLTLPAAMLASAAESRSFQSEKHAFRVVTLVEGLRHPLSMANLFSSSPAAEIQCLLRENEVRSVEGRVMSVEERRIFPSTADPYENWDEDARFRATVATP